MSQEILTGLPDEADAQMLEDAIAYYNSLLANSRRLSEESVQKLNGESAGRKLTFGGKQLCNVLRPHFFTRAQFDYVSQVCTAITDAIETLGQVIMGSDRAEAERLLNDLALTDEERRLLAFDTGYKAFSAHSRLDSFLSGDGTLQFVEYNAESPAGASYEDGLAALFEELPVMQEFRQRFELSRTSVKTPLLAMLLKNYREYLGDREYQTPQIAIVDWPGVPTRTEFELLKAYFEQEGVSTIICTPQELVFRDGALYHDDFKVDLVFKRVLSSELIERKDECAGLFAAYEAGAVCMINSFRCKLFHKKMIFGLLTDPANHKYFDATQMEAIQRHIPWTRRVRAGHTTDSQGHQIELAAFVRGNQTNLVLKPNDEYGGKGLVLGWDCTGEEWDAGWQTGLSVPFVVQEKVTIAQEVFPVATDGLVTFAERMVDCDPYIFDGQVVGALTRLAASGLLNVTAGSGSVVPTFIIEGRGTGEIRPADSEGCV